MLGGFKCLHLTDFYANPEGFELHVHEWHEVILLINGDCEFQIEGNVYKLNPYEIIVASANEMHRIIPHPSAICERFVLSIDSDFFTKNNCTKYATIFQRQKIAVSNYIPWESVRRSGIIDAIKRVEWFYQRGILDVAASCMIEVLYLLKENTVSRGADEPSSTQVQRVLTYINDNLSDDLSLSTIAKNINISSTHICRIFKKQMHMTVQQYITHKRLILAQNLYKNGKSMLEASIEAGFTTYSSFYRMYMKEFKVPPGKDLRSGNRKI